MTKSCFSFCCGNGAEEQPYAGVLVDPDLAKELGWEVDDDNGKNEESSSTRNLKTSKKIQKFEEQIHLLNQHRPSYKDDDVANNDNDVCNRATVVCRAYSISKKSLYIPKYPKTDEQVQFLYDTIQDNFLFMDLDIDECNELIGAMQKEIVSAGTVIIKEGDVGDYYYIVETGTVDFYKNNNKIGSCQSGDTFGELALLYDSPRAATCIAGETTTTTSLWKVDQTTFRYIIARQNRNKHIEIKSVIQKIDLFHNLSPQIISRFVKSFTSVRWKPGSRIVQKGEEGKVFYIIQNGNVRVHDIGLGDSKQQEMILGPNEWFGERALLTGEPRAANVTAIDDVTTLAMDRDTFEDCIGPLQHVMEHSMRKQSIQTIPIFASTPEPEIEQLASLMQEVCYKKGIFLAETGKPYQMKMWIIRQGKVLVHSKKLDTLYNLQAGDYFGDKSIKGDPDHISLHTAICEDNVNAWILTREQIESVIGDISRLGDIEGFTKNKIEKSIALHDLKSHKLLGKGGFGHVYLVSYEDRTSTGENIINTFALKVICKVKVIDAKMTKATIREKELLELLEHPFILHLVTSYQDEINLYLLLPLIHGGELYELLIKYKKENNNKKKNNIIGGMKNNIAAFYSACIIEALGHFHTRQIAYRDLKLENVMIDETGYIRIVDLGFAKIVNDKTFTLCGTPEYLAPEIILSKGHDHAVDYWTYGILTYELLVGQSPFYIPRSSQVEMFRRIVLGQYKIPDYVNDSVKDLIKKLLIRKPNQRIGNLLNGYIDIKQHVWFNESNIDFRKILTKDIPAPWIPSEKNVISSCNPSDCVDVKKMIDNTQRPDRYLTIEEQEIFKGF